MKNTPLINKSIYAAWTLVVIVIGWSPDTALAQTQTSLCQIAFPQREPLSRVTDDSYDVSANSSNIPLSPGVTENDSVAGIVGIATDSPQANVNGLSITYTPTADVGDTTETFTYAVAYIVQGEGTFPACSEATVTINIGPLPIINNFSAVDDDFEILAESGAVDIDVLANDTGDNLQIIEVGATSNGGTVSTNGNSVQYTPPTGFSDDFVDTFDYRITEVSPTDGSRLTAEEGTEIAQVTVRGPEAEAEVEPKPTPTGSTDNELPANPPAPPAPLRVSRSSIGKIDSDLPIARAVENLCDLLSFRGNPRSSGSLTAAQKDLQICACAIVNDQSAGTQRDAIRQLSGGQHQFSNTIIKFAKSNSSAILRRMSEVRNVASSSASPTINNFASSTIMQQLARELPRDETSPDRDSNSSRNPYDSYSSASKQTHSNSEIERADILAYSTNDKVIIGNNSIYFSAPFGGAAGDATSGLFANQTGVFTSVTTGQGDNDDNDIEFDFDSYDITTGIDFTRPDGDKTRVYGGALSIGKVETETRNGGGTDADSIGITLYGTVFGKDGWFTDASLSYSKSDIDIERVINFTASGKTVFQSANGDTEGRELGLSIGGGKEYNLGANNIRADARLRYIDGSVDGLIEQIGVVGANGSGLALQTDDFDIKSFRSELGLQYNRAFGTSFGVVMPFVGVNWIHEFEDRGSDIGARFVVDAYSDGFNQLEESAPGGENRPTLFIIPGSENDSDYARLSLGSSFAFKRGKSAWFSITSIAGLSGINNEQITGGFRWELKN